MAPRLAPGFTFVLVGGWTSILPMPGSARSETRRRGNRQPLAFLGALRGSIPGWRGVTAKAPKDAQGLRAIPFAPLLAHREHELSCGTEGFRPGDPVHFAGR